MAFKDFDIKTLLKLLEKGKYEITAAGFAAIDKIDKIEIPKKLNKRKLPVQVMEMLFNNDFKYYYKSEDQKLTPAQQEAQMLAKLKEKTPGDKR